MGQIRQVAAFPVTSSQLLSRLSSDDFQGHVFESDDVTAVDSKGVAPPNHFRAIVNQEGISGGESETNESFPWKVAPHSETIRRKWSPIPLLDSHFSS